MDKKIDIIIITGFLGAGKTTLLNKLVSTYSGSNLGLLVNDFGQVPVDGSLIRDCSADLDNNRIYEIGNGSIFCSCLTTSFIFGLKYFIQKAPDVLFIETSGMSDPGSMARLLGENNLRDAYRIKHVLSVVDGTNVLKLRKNMAFVDRQIKSSNTVLINKADLIKPDDKREIAEVIGEVNENARIEYTEFCEFDYKSLEFEDFPLDGSAQSCNTSENAPGTMNIPQINVSREPFFKFAGSLVDKTMRLKGFYFFGEKEYYLSNNNGQIEIREISVPGNRTPGLTIIYEGKYHRRIEEDWLNFKKEHAL